MNKDLIKEYANRKYPLCGDYDRKRYGNDRMNEYIVKTTSEAIMLSDGRIVGIDKPSIETHFCFADEGPAYEEYKDLHSSEDKMKAYFFYQNLKGIDEEIADLSEDTWPTFTGFYDNGDGTASVCRRYYDHLTDCGMIEEGLEKHEREPNWNRGTKEDKQKCIEALKQVRIDFEKRLNTWWKKYGVKNLHTWTYWADA